ncbi:MAG: hypothetical protein JW864_08715 [Spirochaetes bacterium]|nr:hypothetical protein [Spirochaetota bacterium]
MEGKIKLGGIIGLSVLLLIAGTCLFVLNYNNVKENKCVKTGEKKTQESKIEVESAVKPETVACKTATIKLSLEKDAEEIYSSKKFNSNEEIKKEFGRLEIVYLFNGREFTGYVVSIDDFYSIVTIDGFKKIPMKDVKCRIIIN